MIREQEWKRLHTSSHNTSSALLNVCLLLIVLYVLYKLYNCQKESSLCKSHYWCQWIGNVVNIKIHTSNESLAMAQEDVPLSELYSQRSETTPRR